MDLETAFSSSMSSKKATKSVFHSPAGGFFSQRKKAFLENVKHSSDEKDISLKSGFGTSVYSDVESLSGDEDVSISGDFDGSLLDLAVNTPKAKWVNTGANFGSLISSPDFEMDEKVKPLPPPLKKKVLLNKIWIDPKIIKTSIEVSVKKLFALDINFLAVEEKLTMTKTQFESMKKAVLLAGENGITVNSNLKKQKFCSDRTVVIKEILMDMLKDMIVTTVAKFGEIRSIKIQLIGMALLFMLPIGTTAHNLGSLLEAISGKTCIINQSLEMGNRFCCAVVGFGFDADLESAFCTEPILALECDTLNVSSPELLLSYKKPFFGANCLQLAQLYAKKNVPVFQPAAFSGKSWAQIVSLAFSAGHYSHLAVLKHSMELLADQISSLVCKLDNLNLVPLDSSPSSSIVAPSSVSGLDFGTGMVLNDPVEIPSSSSNSLNLGLNSSKVLTSKVGFLESKLVVLEVSIGLVLAKLDLLYAGLGSHIQFSSQ
ncbi:hypothetical protein G9A89_010041 [Geosiphon pyriformis]|nr:hypothetical protein G9A89_010041 [Geosiphon pyriformis]